MELILNIFQDSPSRGILHQQQQSNIIGRTALLKERIKERLETISFCIETIRSLLLYEREGEGKILKGLDVLSTLQCSQCLQGLRLEEEV